MYWEGSEYKKPEPNPEHVDRDGKPILYAESLKGFEFVRRSCQLICEGCNIDSTKIQAMIDSYDDPKPPNGPDINKFAIDIDDGSMPFGYKCNDITKVVLAMWECAQYGKPPEWAIYLEIDDEFEPMIEQFLGYVERLYDDPKLHELNFALHKKRSGVRRDRIYGNPYTLGEIKSILSRIPKRPSKRSVRHPVFPISNPHYPASYTWQVKGFGYRNREVWVKNESTNPTGSHKDRWALEKLYEYCEKIQHMLEEKEEKEHLKQDDLIFIPELSVISSGSAAYAMQALLRTFDLPPLRILADNRDKPKIYVKGLKSMGAIFEFTDLGTIELSEKKVLELTKNRSDFGYDITTRTVLESTERNYYDFMVAEILSEKPVHIFVPFGTGGLFTNILCYVEKVIKSGHVCPLSNWGSKGEKIGVYGYTTENHKSSMTKLYAAYRPGFKEIVTKLQQIEKEKIFHANTGIHIMEDGEHLDDAKGAAQKMVQIRSEPSSVAGWAGYLRDKDAFGIKDDEKVLIVNTGRLNEDAFRSIVYAA